MQGDGKLMTTEIVQYKCPSCGHLLGEEEFKHACEKTQRQIDELLWKAEQDIEQIKIQHAKEIEQKNEKHKVDLEIEADKIRNEEKNRLSLKHSQELADKDKQIELARLQGEQIIGEKIKQAIIYNEVKYRQKEKEFELQRSRMQTDYKKLMDRAEKLQKTLDNIPLELRATASEFVLLDQLKEEFPFDEITPKKVGESMADVVQIIVTDTGEKIGTPIVYDRKTGESITKLDITKAKNYKSVHKTDYSLIVTDKGIRNNRLTEEREGILLVHRTIVLDIARRIRSFLIETSRQAKSNVGKDSKQERLYGYFTSLEYTRDMETKLETKSKLDELQRKEEEYHKNTWIKRKELVEKWSDLDNNDTRTIKDITQEDVVSDPEQAARNEDDGDER